MQKLSPDRKTLKNFALTMSIVLLIIGGILLLKQKKVYILFFSLSGLFLLSGLFVPGKLKAVYILWMRIVYLLAWINTRIILTAVFFIIFTPLSLIMRLFRSDPLERKIDRHSNSYWKDQRQEAFDPRQLERQF